MKREFCLRRLSLLWVVSVVLSSVSGDSVQTEENMMRAESKFENSRRNENGCHSSGRRFPPPTISFQSHDEDEISQVILPLLMNLLDLSFEFPPLVYSNIHGKMPFKMSPLSHAVPPMDFKLIHGSSEEQGRPPLPSSYHNSLPSTHHVPLPAHHDPLPDYEDVSITYHPSSSSYDNPSAHSSMNYETPPPAYGGPLRIFDASYYQAPDNNPSISYEVLFETPLPSYGAVMESEYHPPSDGTFPPLNEPLRSHYLNPSSDNEHASQINGLSSVIHQASSSFNEVSDRDHPLPSMHETSPRPREKSRKNKPFKPYFLQSSTNIPT